MVNYSAPPGAPINLPWGKDDRPLVVSTSSKRGSMFIPILLVILVLVLTIFVSMKIDKSPPLTKYLNVNYTNGAAGQQSMDIYLPGKSAPAGGFRALVYIHGGGWIHGDKADEREVLICRLLAERGFVAASINYDLGPRSFPTNLYQCINAVKFLRTNAVKYQLNPAKIAVMGASAGATLACLTGLLNYQQLPPALDLYPGISAQVGLVISLYAVTNTITRVYPQDTTSASGNVHPAGTHRPGHMPKVLDADMCVSCNDSAVVSSRKPACADQAGQPPRKFHCLAQLWELASPALHLPPQIGTTVLTTPPPGDWRPPAFLIIHGTGDAIVNHQQADELAAAVQAVGGQVKLIKVPNAPHGFNLRTDKNGKKLGLDVLSPILSALNTF
jgi:acetyl esterase/lipase